MNVTLVYAVTLVIESRLGTHLDIRFAALNVPRGPRCSLLLPSRTNSIMAYTAGDEIPVRASGIQDRHVTQRDKCG